MYANLLN